MFYRSWIEAEKACTSALQQHRSSKGLYRRAKARRMLGRPHEAIQGKALFNPQSSLTEFIWTDLRAVLRFQPDNKESLAELAALSHAPQDQDSTPANYLNPSSSTQAPRTESDAEILRRMGVAKPKPIKQPPFPRTTAYERKLTINILSCSEDFSSNRKHSQNTNPHGKEKSGAKKSKAITEIERMRIECSSYPRCSINVI